MDRKFFQFVWRYSRREQIFILVLTVVSFPLVYMSLEIPKIIVNEAIDGSDFPKQVLGLELEQVPYLLALCFAFLGLVIGINAIKWVLNVSIGMTGERMLRRLRFMLFERVMRFRMARFRSTKPGEVIQSLLGEIDPLGGFIGETIATPAFQGGLLVVYATFIFVQDLWLGLAAVSLYPVQAWLIPKLQARVIELNKERARNTRALADAISESVGNAPEIQTNDTARWHMAQISGRLHTNTLIRMALFRRKFTIKFINNFMNQLTPFFFYSIGGYLVIVGRLDFGALVAVLAAYKDLAAPWKAVLSYVQRWTDFSSRYVFVIENFMGEDVLGPERIYPPEEGVRRMEGALEMNHVEGGPGTGGLRVPALEVAPGETVAVLGGDSGARESFMRMAAGLELPVTGTVSLGGQPLADATLPEIGASIAYVGAEPGMVNYSVRLNLLYGLLHAAPDIIVGSDREAELLLREARATGNIQADPDGDWIDYRAAGVDSVELLDRRVHEVIEAVGLASSVLTGALETRLTPEEAERWSEPILQARAELAGMWDEDARRDLLDPWEPERFNANASLLENVLFALPVSRGKDIAAYADLPEVRAVLDRIGAEPVLERIGRDIAGEFAALVEAVGESSAVLDSFNAYPRARILAAAELVGRGALQRAGGASEEERAMIRSLALIYVDRRDNLDVMTEARIGEVLACRQKAREALAGREDFVQFDEERVSPANTVAENILNAKRRYDRRSAWRELEDRLDEAIRAAGLRDELLSLGLLAPVGTGGSALPTPARRRIGLARAVIKRPGLLLLDGVAASAAPEDARLRSAVRRMLPDAIILYAAGNEEATADADRVLWIDADGAVHEQAGQPPGRLASGE